MREGLNLYIGGPPKKPKSWWRRALRLFLLIAVLGAAFFYAIERYEPDGVPILEYHKVNDQDLDRWTQSKADFTAQMDYLKAAGYNTVLMRHYLRSRKGEYELPKKPIILTFDDGYADMIENVAPILKERGMRGIVYMVTNYVGLKGRLTWPALRQLQMNGFETGSHTANHRPLTDLDRKEATDEIRLSNLMMNWNGLKWLLSLSYPDGQYDERLPEILKENGYQAAVTGQTGYNTISTDPYRLNRINIPRSMFHGKFGSVAELRLRIARAKLYHILGWDR